MDTAMQEQWERLHSADGNARSDIVEGLRKLYDAVQDEAVREAAIDLIATESDPTYQKKYAGVWRRK